MRVIAGRYRGLILAEFKGNSIRPTADRVKESLFNIISSRVIDAEVLDLFCGSGSLGIESLSRGAKNVHFNDVSRDSISVLKKNLARLKQYNYVITNCDFSCCLKKNEQFDIIFVDPPYSSESGIAALKMLANDNRLKANGVIIFERDKSFGYEINGLKIADERKYGKTYLTFFERRDI